VTFDGAKRNYGVVVTPGDFTVDEASTQALREEMRGARPKDWAEVTYNRGGRIEELRRVCLEETGLEPPRPQWETDPYGPHTGLPYVREWYGKMREEKGWVLEDKIDL